MASNPRVHCIDFATLTPHQRYKILIGSIVPRPIALISTIDADGRVNAAPFSFFNALSADPPLVGLGLERHDDGSPKDTLRNIEATNVFTVNIVSDALVEAMNICAITFMPGEDELAAAGLTARPGVEVASPRITEAAIALECRRTMTIPTGPHGEIIIAEVVLAHIRENLCDPTGLRIDPHTLDAIGRMGGQGYARTREYFDLSVSSLQDWQKTRNAGARRWR